MQQARTYRQQVPRPAWARRVPAAAWPAPCDLSLPAATLALAGELQAPGSAVPGHVTAAVLVALVDAGGGEAGVLLIMRAYGLAANPGEIAFPGGRLEPGEAPLDCALRESEEEVGLPPASVDVLGWLPVRSRARSPGAIAPLAGAVAQLPALAANEGEVDEILVVPLSVLVAEGNYWEELWSPPGTPEFVMSFFAGDGLGDDLVWGATARILKDLLLAVTGIS